MNTWLASIPLWAKALRFIGRPCIIVTRDGGIGDVICLLPSLVRLKKQHPGCTLIFITSKACAPLVELSGIADLVLPGHTRGLRLLRSLLHPFLDLTPTLPDEQTPAKPRAHIHLMEEFANALGVESSSLVHPLIKATTADVAGMQTLLNASSQEEAPIAVIHTGHTWPVKLWPTENWIKLTKELNSLPMRVLQIGATGHDRDASAKMPHIPETQDWRDKLTLGQTLGLLSIARIFIGIDSGMLHLAAAAGTPLIGLFGPTDPACFLPKRKDAIGLSGQVGCLGCHHAPAGPQHWRTGCKYDVRCMSSLSSEMVATNARSLLSDTYG